MGFPPVNFDVQHPNGSGSLNPNVSVQSDTHTALVREIASASAVLLKNNRTATAGEPAGITIRGLPLAASRVKMIAVIGLNSLEFIVPPIDAITSFVGTSANITSSLSNNLTAGPAAATGKDVAFVFVNVMSGELGIYVTVEGNQGNRNDLELWYEGGSLVEAVAAVNNNTVVVVHSVGPVYMPWSTHSNITAIIYAGAPGEQTGPSIVDVLYGKYNPSGRLPFSIAGLTYTEKLLLDYQYMEANSIIPRFEFGYGLSYTTFQYSPSSLAWSGTSLIFAFTITNTGAFAGMKKPQLYLSYPSSTGELSKVLQGFEEVVLDVSASSLVNMTLSERDMR
ncbi:hypothetical protein C0992_000763 [Termitomyces sp. T32_za158]|nr:hypothetical protein C0992_000763 [Termitomyces sp. T32_za158]